MRTLAVVLFAGFLGIILGVAAPFPAHAQSGIEQLPGAVSSFLMGQQLESQVRDRLQRTQGIDLSDINVTVSGNDVYVTGTVESQQERDAVEEVIRSVQGVRNVYTGNLQVRSYSQPAGERGREPFEDRERGESLYNRVEDAVRGTGVASDNISLAVSGNDVYVTGAVESQREKDAVEDAVRSVRGVRNVYTGDLQVGPYSQPRGGERGREYFEGGEWGANLYNRVEDAVRGAGLDPNSIGIDVRGSNVYLSGTVGSQQEMDALEDAVNSVEGVRRVSTRDVRVSPYAQPMRERERESSPGNQSGENLNSRVREALQRAPGVDASAIDVTVKGRDVYLSGTVGSDQEKRAAHDVAHSLEGVESVYTRDLKVR